MSHENIDINYERLGLNTPLGATVEMRNGLIVRMLLGHPDIRIDKSALPIGIEKGTLAIMEMLLEKDDYITDGITNTGNFPSYRGYDGDPKKMKLLDLGAECGNLYIFKLLLEKDTRPLTQSIPSALSFAAGSANGSVVREIIIGLGPLARPSDLLC